MADLETREDGWARGVFDRVRTVQHEPPWIPDAAAAARLSGRHRTRFRAAGAVAAVAVAGLSATAFTTLGGSVFRGGDTVSPAAGPTTWSGLDLTRYLEIGGMWESGSYAQKTTPDRLSPTGLATISVVLQRLDPGLKHIRTTTGPHDLDIRPNPPGVINNAIQTQGFWAPKGDVSSFPPPGTSFRPTSPFGSVDITPMAPGLGKQVNMAGSPCGLSAVVSSGQIPQPTAWSPCVQAHQSDGSDIVTTHSVNLAAGTVTLAERLFPDGSAVQIIASSVIGRLDTKGFEAGPSLDPVPWTDAGLAQALAGPDIKGLP
jgi:hypothetical protein